MLIVAKTLRDLRFSELMQVYEQSNLEAAGERKDLPPMFALQQVEQDHRQYLREVFFRTHGAHLCIWEEGGRYVSALRLEPYRDGLLLAALDTAPACRRQGYGAALIRAVQQLPGCGKIYSHVDKRNTASLRTHEKCGFRILSDHAVYLNGSVDYRCHTLVYEMEHPCIT